MTTPQASETMDLDLTAPFRVEGDPDGSETLLTWLRTNKFLFLATSQHFQRFSEILQNEALAFTVFRQVSTIRRAKGEGEVEGGCNAKRVSKGFERLEKAKGIVW